MKHIERVYSWALVTPAVLPLVVWPSLIYPNLVPKTLLFYTITFLSIVMFGILVAQGRAFYWGRLARWEAQMPLALLVLAYGTSAAGLDFYRSFWSLLVRGDGLLMLTCVVASFYLIVLSVDRAWYDRLLKTVSIVATGIAVYGIGEWLLEGGRIGSLIGNAAFFAGYLGVAFFATLLSCVGVAGLSKGWRRFAYVGAALQVLAIILTATRGTILALVVAGGAYLVYLSYAGRGVERTWSAGAVAALVILGSLFFVFRGDLAKVPFEPIARVASISRADPDVASRLFIWEHMITEIKKSPWLGVGAEHIDVLFNRFYDPTQISEQWFDRSHNAFLDYATQYGVIGLLCYLGIIISFVTLAAALWRCPGKGSTQEDGRSFAILVVLLTITYAVQNFFVFDTISSFWLFLALLALVVGVSSNVQKSAPFSVPAGGRYVAWLGAAVLVWLIIPVSVRPALAAYDLSQAYKYQLVDVPKEVGYLSQGFALGVVRPRAGVRQRFSRGRDGGGATVGACLSSGRGTGAAHRTSGGARHLRRRAGRGGRMKRARLVEYCAAARRDGAALRRLGRYVGRCVGRGVSSETLAQVRSALADQTLDDAFAAGYRAALADVAAAVEAERHAPPLEDVASNDAEDVT
jgi:O-antigen ligase